MQIMFPMYFWQPRWELYASSLADTGNICSHEIFETSFILGESILYYLAAKQILKFWNSESGQGTEVDSLSSSGQQRWLSCPLSKAEKVSALICWCFSVFTLRDAYRVALCNQIQPCPGIGHMKGNKVKGSHGHSDCSLLDSLSLDLCCFCT